MKDEQRRAVLAAFERLATDMGYLRDLIFAEELEGAQPDRLRITAQPRLRVRQEPDNESAIMGYVYHGAGVDVLERRDNWGRIAEPAGWIDLSWTEAMEP